MLHLEKSAVSDSTYVTLREQARLCTPTFLRAFGLAFGLHAFGFLFFQVHPFRMTQASTQFPPVQVNIEIALPDSAIYADLDLERTSNKTLAEPAWPTLWTPRLALRSPDRSDLFAAEGWFPKAQVTADAPGARIEEWVALGPGQPKSVPVPQIHLFGALADRPLIADTLPVQAPASKKSVSERLVYAVKVDDESGGIFWYSPTVKGALAEQAEALLRALRFKPLAGGFVTEGWVEVCVAGRVK